MALKVATAGGGTGHYALLRTLGLLPDIDITAVVSMADSGGSSGRLRDTYGALPPGDILQCLVALSELPGEVARDLLRHRFQGGELNGDNAGNWLLTVLAQTTGSFVEAVRYCEQFLRVRKGSHVLPVTVGQITLRGQSEQGVQIAEEAQFDELNARLSEDDRIAKVWLEPNALVLGEAVRAFREADYIILSPGDLFSSVIPVLLVEGVREVLRTTSAPLIYVCNLVTTRGQTDNFTVPDFVAALEQYLPRQVDAVLYHTHDIDEERARKYAAQDQAYPVRVGELSRLEGRQLFPSSFLAEGELVRHDEHQLATILGILLRRLPKGAVALRGNWTTGRVATIGG